MSIVVARALIVHHLDMHPKAFFCCEMKEVFSASFVKAENITKQYTSNIKHDSNFKMNQRVFAKWCEDETWYRAKITHISNQGECHIFDKVFCGTFGSRLILKSFHRKLSHKIAHFRENGL